MNNTEISAKVAEICNEFKEKFNAYTKSLGEGVDMEMCFILLAQDLDGTHAYGAGTMLAQTQMWVNALGAPKITKPLHAAVKFCALNKALKDD